MTTTAFKPVADISNGGTGIPVPTYLLTYQGETIQAVSKAREALDWLAGRGPGFACVALLDGARREICRNV